MTAAVIFDLDDTLIIEEATARASFLEASQLVEGHSPQAIADLVRATAREIWRSSPHHSLCLELGLASWEGLWATFDHCHPSLERLRAWAPAYKERTWSTALAKVEIKDDPLARAMSCAYIDAQRRGHRAIEGAVDSVRSLERQLPLGLLTNGPPDIQRRKLAATGLRDCFASVVISGEIGFGKPDPRAFVAVTSGLGVAPEDAVMVGDSWERDVKGAVSVGMSAVWISSGRAVPDEIAGVEVIDRLGELAGVLD